MAKKVCILIGSDSDRGIAEKAIEVLSKFNVPYDLYQASAHREPKKVEQIVQSTDAELFICIAGLAAALPGFVASLTNKPVIGVPKDAKLMGLDSLLSMVQMPSGIPVATVGIDNGKNAAYLAIRILGIKYPEVLTGETSGSTYSSQSHSPSYSSSSGSKSTLSSFEFTPPTPTSSSSTPTSFAAFPLFSPEPTTTPQVTSYRPQAAYAQSSAMPQAPSPKPQAGTIFGDWGLKPAKPKERPKGDWLQY